MNTPDTLIDQKPFRCLIIGVGGCGCTILNKMIAAEYGGRIQYGESTHYSEVTYLAVDSDSVTLEACKAEQKIFIPKAVLDESELELQEQLASIPNADMVFVVSGMGGATGTKISPVIASCAKQREALTIGVATLPLPDKGEPRMASAKRGISNLYQSANSVIVTHMDELLSEATPAFTIEDVYAGVGKVIIAGITAIVDV
jgi:cell division protein FtsZ